MTANFVVIANAVVVATAASQAEANAAAKQFAIENKVSAQPMTAAEYAERKSRMEAAQLSRQVAAKIAQNADVAEVRASTKVLKSGFDPSQAEALQAAINLLLSDGRYAKTVNGLRVAKWDVLARAQRGEPLSPKQIAWLFGQAARLRSERATKAALVAA